MGESTTIMGGWWRGAAIGLVVLLAGLLASAPAANAQDFPSRAVKIIMPFPPAGGTLDTLARMVAEEFQVVFRQPAIVENRAGAGGGVGTEFVFRAAPDGYTILCAPQFTYSVSRLLFSKQAFDPRQLEPISVLAHYPAILLVRRDLPVDNTAGLIAYAKANPGKLNYGSQGIGTIGHLVVEHLMHAAQIRMAHIPFRGSAAAVTGLLGGQVDVVSDLLPNAKSNIEAGKIKLIGVAGPARLKAFPEVPIIQDVLPGFEADTWMGLAVPPGTARDITQKLSQVIVRAFARPDIKARIEAIDLEPLGTTPDGMREMIKRSEERWAPVIKAAKIAVD